MGLLSDWQRELRNEVEKVAGHIDQKCQGWVMKLPIGPEELEVYVTPFQRHISKNIPPILVFNLGFRIATSPHQTHSIVPLKMLLEHKQRGMCQP